jgi:hypothetical protein
MTVLHTSHTWSPVACASRPIRFFSSLLCFLSLHRRPNIQIDSPPQCASSTIYIRNPCGRDVFLSSSPPALAGSTVIRNGSRSPAPVLCCACFAVQSPVQRPHLRPLLVRPSGCISDQPIPVVLQQPHRHFRSTSARNFRPGARAHIFIFCEALNFLMYICSTKYIRPGLPTRKTYPRYVMACLLVASLRHSHRSGAG